MVRFLCGFAPLREKRKKETRDKSLLTVRFLCAFAALRAKKQKLKVRNKPSLLALALMSLVPWSLKKVINFRSPQKTQVTCH
jgi:hypothetical protein